MKRAFDFSVSLIMIFPAAIICCLAAVPVWIEGRCNPLFIQTRVGKHQKQFTMLKMRTMRPDTGNFASHEVGQNQILRSGHLLRRSKIDELPQLWNVLIGQMSLVGPRPCLPVQLELIEERQKRGVYSIRPGITGKAQLMGVDMSVPIRLAELDAKYVAEQSLSRDLHYLSATFFGRGRGDAAKSA